MAQLPCILPAKLSSKKHNLFSKNNLIFIILLLVRQRDNSDNEPGMSLLRQLVLARAFPEVTSQQRQQLVTELFEQTETLERLCHVSGGHIRNLLGLLYSCLQRQDPPFSRDCLEAVIKDYRDDLLLAIDECQWELLFEVVQQQTVKGESDYQSLLRSMYLFE